MNSLSLNSTCRWFKPALISILVVGACNLLNAEDRIVTLNSVSRSDSSIKVLRDEIRRSIFIIKSRRKAEELPGLKFYIYNTTRNDNFWTVLTNTSQNIDTLMTVNGLGSPGEVVPGKTLYIPNMRGILYRVKDGDTLESISKKYNIKPEYITAVNNMEHQLNPFLFIPCAEVSNLERSLFLGTGFRNPLLIGMKTSGFGTRRDPFNNRIQFHKGIDIACPRGSRIHAAREGKVVSCGFEGGYGLLVVLKHSHDYYTYYGHLSKILVKPGQEIKTGELIALSGNTGRTTGPHLHFEVRKGTKAINPGMLLRVR